MLKVSFGKWLSQPPQGDEVVVSGLSGRLPESESIHEFQDNLFNKKDMVTADGRRWFLDNPEIPQRNAKIYNTDKFDGGYFGVHSRQAESMDPLMRKFLEVAVETVIDAGVNPLELEGSNTGVFVGACFSEMENETLIRITEPQRMGITGYLRFFIPNRISYHLKLKGPSYIVDTACSSSLNAIEHAFKAIRSGECNSALVGGVNLLFHPSGTLQFYRLGVLSDDGTCKVFDENADGYVRGEAITCVYLQKAKDAKRIYTKIINTKVNCDGFKSLGITFPSSQMQQQLMTEILDDSGLTPSHLSFVEAHATGTEVGDPEEVKAIDNAFAKRRDEPLLIGSVKSSIGHTEPASGLCSLIKVIIAMETGYIPPNINLNKIRSGMEGFEQGRLKVVTNTTKLEIEDAIIAVNNFGFGGNNCHMIVQRFNKTKVDGGLPSDDIPRLICVSGRTAESISTLLDNLNRKPMDTEYIGLLHQLFKKYIPGYYYRGYTVISKNGPLKTSFKFSVKRRRPLYVFFGEFQQNYKILGKQLLEFPVFQNSMLRINDFLPKNINIIDIICQENGISDNNLGPIAVQIGIVDILKTIKLCPTNVYGDSLGRLAFAYFYDAITLKDVISIALKYDPVTGFSLKKDFETVISNLVSSTINTQDLINVFSSNGLNCRNVNVLNISDTVKKENKISLIDDTVKFMEVLGTLYEEGHDLDLQHLYPQIDYPVSRSTPMISPLIKWNHKKSWYTYKFKGFQSLDTEQREFTNSLEIDDHKFIAGHVIDGRNLFPATGYLKLVWETYALSRRLLITDLPVVFENCRFIKAVTMPKIGYLNLLVSIQQGTGFFEVLHQDSLVVTGRIYSPKDTSVSLTPINFLENDPKFILEQDEIYRELYLRGYNYSGSFKGLLRCNTEVSLGLAKWENNWVTLMDTMLQMKILQIDSRLLYVPTGIKRLTIEPSKLLAFVEDKEECLMPVNLHKDCDSLTTYGIEFFGIHANSVSRRKYTTVPVLEKYEFVPNSTEFDVAKSIRVNIQIVLENSLENNFKAIEIVDYPFDNIFLMPLVLQVLEDVPLVNPDLTIATKATLEEIPGIKIEYSILTAESNLLLIIGTKFLQKSNLTPILNALNRNGFVLTREEVGFVPEENDSIEIVTQHKTTNETFILFRKSVQISNTKLIKISSTRFDWLPVLQESLKHDARIVVYSQNQELDGIIGLVNCLRREPGGNKVSCLFITAGAPEFNLECSLYSHQIKKNLAVNVYNNHKWGTYRHLLLEDVEEIESEHCYVNTTKKGDLSSLKWIETPLSANTLIKKNSVLIYCYYSAINFRDIMVASGRINADVLSSDRIEQQNLLGFEFAGRDLSGRRLSGMTNNAALSTLVLADEDFLWTVPETWSLEDAATIPVVYCTVIYALLWVCSLKPDISILIHSATGGIGIAALNVCLHYGFSQIFATVGTHEKREFLKQYYPQIPDSHIGNSHDTSFEEMIKTQTGGRGVDVVLNSLTEEKLQASVRCLSRGGQLLEIGKFDLANDASLNLLLLEKECSYHGIMVDRIVAQSQEIKAWLVKKLSEGITLGFVKPLPRTVFKQNEVETAFRYMTTGKHIGKVLINVREEEKQKTVKPSEVIFKGVSRFYCELDKSYIIIGGLGGFGMELADWLVLRGAKKLILVSTSGVKTGYQTQRIRIWKSYGVIVKISKIDITNREGCISLINEANKLGPIDGIFNLAVVLQDSLFEDQNEEKFRVSLAPKAQVTLYLDQVTRKLCPNIRYFVVFSSVSCGRGNAGQTNYGMANSIMERICEQRKRDGLPALAIQWGAIAEVGLVAKMQKDNRDLVIGGTLQQKVSNCLEVLDKFLKQKHPIVASMVVAEKRSRGFEAGSAVDAVAYILGIKDIKTVNHEATLAELGMDSITATEIIQLLEKDFEIYITPKDIRNLTFAKLIKLESEKHNEVAPLETIEKGVNLLLQFVPEMKNISNLHILELSSQVTDDEGAGVVFVLPGIEGVFSPLEPLTRGLKARVFGVQYSYNNPEDSIEETAKTVLQFIKKYVDQKQLFHIIGYSFGTIVALELSSLLENEGYTCKIIVIDGSPAYLRSVAEMHFKSQTEAELQTTILFDILAIIFPQNLLLDNKDKFLKCKDFQDRIDLAKSLVPPNVSKNDLDTQGAIALYKRFKSVFNYKFSHNKIKSSVNLFKAQFPIIVIKIDEDYELAEFCEKPVNVTIVEGDHVTMLSQAKLLEGVNELLLMKD